MKKYIFCLVRGHRRFTADEVFFGAGDVGALKDFFTHEKFKYEISNYGLKSSAG